MLLVVVLLGIAAVGADRWRHSDEVRSVTAAVVAAEDAVELSRLHVAGVVEYQSVLLFRDGVRPAIRTSLLLGLAREAARNLPRLMEMRASVAEIRLLPWHSELRAAVRSYLSRLDAWIAHLTRTADNAEALFRPAPAVAETRSRAAAALEKVSPTAAAPLR